MTSGRPVFLLVTSNGTGMGHLSRQLAVGLAGRPVADAVLFSHSIALPTVSAQGLPGEYCPGPDRAWVPAADWPHYLRDRLLAIIDEIGADIVAFDGVAPYRGLYLARSRAKHVPFVWFRRGMWKRGANEGQLWKSDLFDAVIEPGDLAAMDDPGATADRNDAIRVPPVTLLDVIPQVERSEAAAALGLDPTRPTLLVTLGSGRLGEVASPAAIVLDGFDRHPEWQVAVTRSGIAHRFVNLTDRPSVVELQGVYPLVRYLKAFDAAVSAAGYNAVHEIVADGLPTLLVPNTETRTDDQVTRATSLARRGLCLTASPDSPADLAAAVDRLCDPSCREDLMSTVANTPADERSGGAAATVQVLLGTIQSHETVPPSPVTRARRARDAAKESVKRALGPDGTNRVRRLLGRAPTPIAERVRVRIVDGAYETAEPTDGIPSLTLSESIGVDVLTGDDPVEHLLAGSSTDYRTSRRAIIDRYYDVAD